MPKLNKTEVLEFIHQQRNELQKASGGTSIELAEAIGGLDVLNKLVDYITAYD